MTRFKEKTNEKYPDKGCSNVFIIRNPQLNLHLVNF